MPFDLKSILILVLVIGFVLSVNLTLFGLLRNDKTIKAETSKWGLAFGGGRQGQRKTEADLAALRSAVAGLQVEQPPANDQPKHE
jgi:hypothetical protein